MSDETLKSLYPDRAAYLDRWNRAVDKLIESSAVLPEDASVMRLQGETVRLPLE